jgi:hypothetical protein
MALYKNGDYVKQSNHAGFDDIYSSGDEAANAGIYRCTVCGDEIVIAEGHRLPPETHHKHEPGLGKIQWQLIVCAVGVEQQ